MLGRNRAEVAVVRDLVVAAKGWGDDREEDLLPDVEHHQCEYELAQERPMADVERRSDPAHRSYAHAFGVAGHRSTWIRDIHFQTHQDALCNGADRADSIARRMPRSQQ